MTIPWDESRPLNDIKYFIERNTNLNSYLEQIRDISYDSDTVLRIHIVGLRGAGKSTVMQLLRHEAEKHLVCVHKNVENLGDRATTITPEQRQMHVYQLAKEIVYDMWKGKYKRPGYIISPQITKIRLMFKNREASVALKYNPSIEFGGNLPAVIPLRSQTYLLEEMEKVLNVRSHRSKGIAIFLDEADDLVNTTFLRGLVNDLAVSTLPHLLVVATAHPFLTLFQGYARRNNYRPQRSDYADIDSLSGRFFTISVGPYETSNPAELQEVIDKAIYLVMEDYNLENGTSYEFDAESAKLIAWYSAGHLYLVNLLCHHCFDTCKSKGDLIYLNQQALRQAQGRIQYKMHIDPTQKTEIWEDAERIETRINNGVVI